jgi:hypothetical protein
VSGALNYECLIAADKPKAFVISPVLSEIADVALSPKRRSNFSFRPKGQPNKKVSEFVPKETI